MRAIFPIAILGGLLAAGACTVTSSSGDDDDDGTAGGTETGTSSGTSSGTSTGSGTTTGTETGTSTGTTTGTVTAVCDTGDCSTCVNSQCATDECADLQATCDGDSLCVALDGCYADCFATDDCEDVSSVACEACQDNCEAGVATESIDAWWAMYGCWLCTACPVDCLEMCTE